MAEQPRGTVGTAVAQDRNWKRRVETELSVQTTWQRDFGFLASNQEQADALDAFKKNAVSSTVALCMRDSWRRQQGAEATSPGPHSKSTPVSPTAAPGPNDTLDSFVQTYKPTPKDMYRRPCLTSHSYGWGQSLEKFGALKLHMR